MSDPSTWVEPLPNCPATEKVAKGTLGIDLFSGELTKEKGKTCATKNWDGSKGNHKMKASPTSENHHISLTYEGCCETGG